MKKLINIVLMLSFVVGGVLAPIGLSIESEQESLIPLQVQSAEAQNDFENSSLIADCGSWDVGCHIGNFFLWYFELIWYRTTQVVAFISGFVLDVLLYHSISSATYRTGIIEAGWEILRNFVNIIFIFSLLFIAFKMVFGSGSKVKSYLIKTILIALVINFSLFATYLVVDASNILANIFYSRISTEGNIQSGSQLTILDEFFSEQSRKSPSAALVNNFNPQIIVQKIDGNLNLFQRFMMVFAAGGINILMIWLFLGIILLFLGRTVGLILSAIMAPLAFATLTIPSSGAVNLPFVGFDKWLKELISLSFMAPIYLFFLYLIIEFTGDNALFNSISVAGNTGEGAGNVINLIIGVLLPFALIAVLLYTAKKVTTMMAGDLGGRIAGGVTKLAVGAATVATGSAAIAATGGAAIAGGGLRAMGAKGSKMNNFGRRLQTAKFDISKIPGFNNTFGKSGAAKMAARGINTSYADVDTATRRGVNKAKGWRDDMRTGRTSAPVQRWQDAIQESEDNLTARKMENASNQAGRNIPKDNIIKGFDSKGDPIYQTASNPNKMLEEYRAALGKRNSAQAKIEKDNLIADQDKVQLEVDSLQDEIKSLREAKGSTAQIAANKAKINAKRRKITKLNKQKEDFEKTTLEGKIKQLEKIKERTENDAKANVVKNESKKQQSRVGEGKIKTGSKIGGDPNNA